MMTRVLLTLLVGLLVSLGALVSGVEPVLAKNWNLSEQEVAEKKETKIDEQSTSIIGTSWCFLASRRWQPLYPQGSGGFSNPSLIDKVLSPLKSPKPVCGDQNSKIISMDDILSKIDDGSLSIDSICSGTRDYRGKVATQFRELIANLKLECDYYARHLMTLDVGAVCNKSTLNGQWETKPQYLAYVKEAKRRGLSCGVSEPIQIASAQVTKFKPPVTSSSSRLQSYRQKKTTLRINKSILSEGDKRICSVATVNGSWESISGPYFRYVQEAKRRGLTCGVGKSTQTASAQVPKAKPQVTSAALTAAQRKAEKLEQELAALKEEKAKQQQTISSDTKLPTITIASASSNGPQGTVKGRVTDNAGIAEVRVDGKQIQTDSYGNFMANTYVPEGGVSVSIQAVDLAGLSSSMSVRLERSASNTVASISFERLNPLGRKVARNKDALALIIGVDGYKSTPARAIYADSDAKVFADYASEKLGIPSNRIKTLVNDGAGEREMLLSVKSWLSRASRQGKTDVYIFFAGHGLASDDGQKMYLLPYDGAPELLDDTAILRERLFADIASANPRSVTVFLDTCYSGTTRGTDMLIASRPIAIKALEQSIPDNFTVMTAARGDQTAKPLEEAKHGMFSYFLMKGMEGEADKNRDNKITAGELHQYVQSNVVQQSSGSQTPELQGDAERVLVRFQ